MSYLIRRLEFFFITLWAALTINFILPRIMPGNPAQAMIVRFRRRVSPETVKAIEVAFGLHSNESVFQQYLEYLRNTFTGNFGTSVTFFPVPVGDVITVTAPEGRLSPMGVLPRVAKFRVAGTVHSGLYEFDAQWAYLPLAAAQRLFGQGDRASLVEVKIDDMYAVRQVASGILDAVGEGYLTRERR